MIQVVAKKIENKSKDFFMLLINKYLNKIQFFLSDIEKEEVIKDLPYLNSDRAYKVYLIIKSIFYYERTIFLSLKSEFPDLEKRYEQFCKMTEQNTVLDDIKQNLKILKN